MDATVTPTPTVALAMASTTAPAADDKAARVARLRLLIRTFFADANWFDGPTAWRKTPESVCPAKNATDAQKAARREYVAKVRATLLPDLLARLDAFRADGEAYNDVQGENSAKYAELKGVPMHARSLTVGQSIRVIESAIRGEYRAQSALNRRATVALK